MLEFKKWSFWERESYLNNIDYLIVGSGIVGLSTAIELKNKKPEKKVLVLEKGNIPTGASTKNAGFACFGSPTEILDDLSKGNEKEVWETIAKRWKGLQILKERIGDELDYLNYGSWELFKEDEKEIFEKCVEQIPFLNQKIEEITGEKDCFIVNNEAIEQFGFENIHSTIKNRLEGQIDTGKMMVKLQQIAIEKGALILNGVEVLKVNEQENFIEIETQLGNLQSEKCCICTNGFSKTLFPEMDVEPARAQVLITEPIPHLSLKGTFHYQEGYYYFRNIGNRILLGGARNLDFQTENTTEFQNTNIILSALSNLLKDVILPETPHTIEHVWTGIMGVGEQKNPIIKQINQRLFCGIRLGGMGVALGSAIGKELAELISE